jgi:hypothetical protein
VSYNMQYGMPGSQPSWTENYLAGLADLSGSQAPGAQINTLSPVNANGVLPVAAPTSASPLSRLGRLGGWLGKNAQTIGTFGNLAMQGINAYVGLQQLGLAKDAFKFEKAAFKTNLANQVDSYNTQMKDRTTGRWYATEEERQAALKDAELPPGMRG